MTIDPLTPIVYQLQDGLQNPSAGAAANLLSSMTQNFDIARIFNGVDFTTVGLWALAGTILFYLVALAGTLLWPWGRNLATQMLGSGNQWQDGPGQFGFTSRSMGTLSTVLDSLTEAVQKWNEIEDETVNKSASTDKKTR